MDNFELNNSVDMIIEDKQNKEIIGEEAINSYYDHYKNLQKITQ